MAQPSHYVQRLDDGTEIKVIGFTRMHSTNGVNKWLILDYQTDLEISDVEGLKKEADQIWPYFKNQVEQAGMDEALIRANSPPTGMIVKETKSYGIPYKKAPDGTWKRTGG
jgi:hypothetical protein